jgi:hypothetical protein
MNHTQETIDLAKASLADPQAAILAKAGWAQPSSATSGINAYDLETPSKKLFPVLSPLRNMLPRDGSGVGTAVNWRAVTGINTGNLTAGVSEGARGGMVTTTTTDNTIGFKGLGLEDNVTFEAQYAGKSFEDVRALAQLDLLSALMIEEERIILGGCSADTLATPAAPVGTLKAGGSMTAQVTYAYVVALTLEGFRQSSVSGGIPGTVSRNRTGPYGGSDTIALGNSHVSSVSNSVTTATTNLSALWTVTAVRGAVAYAWFTGPTGAGNAILTAITTTNSFLQLADATGSQAANDAAVTTDHSGDTTVFDGIIGIASKSGNNGYWKSLDNAALTSDGAGGCVEIDAMLQDRYDNYRLGFERIWFSSADAKNFKKKILTQNSANAFQFFIQDGEQIKPTGGSMIPEYLNMFTGETIRMMVHPYLPQGTLIAETQNLPYRLNGVPNVLKIKARQDYYSLEWPQTRRAYEYGVYADEVLQCYFFPALGVISNIGNS